ncbi:MAG: FliM/FliN family flagellar motor switch protein [Sphingobium sp.]
MNAHVGMKGGGRGSPAQHAETLLAGGQSATTDLDPLNQLAGRLRKGMKMGLEPILNTLPEVTLQPAAMMRYDAYMAHVPSLASNSLFRVKRSDARFLLSVDGGAIMRLVDRYFGGSGAADPVLPQEFPMSAELMIDRLETMIVARLADAMGSTPEIEREKHEATIAHLAYLEPSDQIVLSRMTVSEAAREPWHIDFVFAGTALRMLAPKLANRVTSRRPGRADWDDLVQSPLGEVPLTVRAVMAESSISMATIAALEPGQILPISLARHVALRVGEQAIGFGTMGKHEDRMAVRLKQILKD